LYGRRGPLLGGAPFSSYKYTYKPVMQSYA
jgi:hypothetical protein